LPGYFKLVEGHNKKFSSIKLAYASTDTVQAFEDTVLFAPQLYKLMKATIMTEPISNFFTNPMNT
jgi:hypothetical protein